MRVRDAGISRRRIRGLAGAAVAALLAVPFGAVPAAAAVTCVFDPGSGLLTITYDTLNQEITVLRAGDAITVTQKTAPATTATAVTCSGGSPTVNDTGQIAVRGTAAANQDLRIDLTGGQFAPGVPAEGAGTSEIEFDGS